MDANFFPHIIDDIFKYASREALWTLRQASRTFHSLALQRLDHVLLLLEDDESSDGSEDNSSSDDDGMSESPYRVSLWTRNHRLAPDSQQRKTAAEYRPERHPTASGFNNSSSWDLLFNMNLCPQYNSPSCHICMFLGANTCRHGNIRPCAHCRRECTDIRALSRNACHSPHHNSTLAQRRVLSTAGVLDFACNEMGEWLVDYPPECLAAALPNLQIVRQNLLYLRPCTSWDSLHRVPVTTAHTLIVFSPYQDADWLPYFDSTIVPEGIRTVILNCSYAYGQADRSLDGNMVDAIVHTFNIPSTLRHIVIMFTNTDPTVLPDSESLHKQLTEGTRREVSPCLGWLHRFSMQIAARASRVRYTIVGATELDPALLGWEEAPLGGKARSNIMDQLLEATTGSYLGCDVLADVSVRRTFKATTEESRAQGVRDNVEILTMEEYLASLSPRDLALQTVPPPTSS